MRRIPDQHDVPLYPVSHDHLLYIACMQLRLSGRVGNEREQRCREPILQITQGEPSHSQPRIRFVYRHIRVHIYRWSSSSFLLARLAKVPESGACIVD